MIHQYDGINLCAYVQQGKVRYIKEYTLRGRIMGTEFIPYSEFVRLLYQQSGYKMQSDGSLCS